MFTESISDGCQTAGVHKTPDPLLSPLAPLWAGEWIVQRSGRRALLMDATWTSRGLDASGDDRKGERKRRASRSKWKEEISNQLVSPPPLGQK